MHSFLHLTFLCGLLALFASAAPTTVQKRSFKVDRVQNTNFKGHNGPKELLKAYRKYGMPIPAGLEDAINRKHDSSATVGGVKAKSPVAIVKDWRSKSSGSFSYGTRTNTSGGYGVVTATPQSDDVEYLAPVEIGGQTLNLDFDTGSADLWVFSTEMSQSALNGHTAYDPSKSSTMKTMDGASFSISYGDGSGARGKVGTEVVSIGGVTVRNQAVELATTVSKSFLQDTDSDGLLGLAFSKLNSVKPRQQKTFFDNVMSKLDEPVFTASLHRGASGTYEFGRIDKTKYSGDLAWTPVNDEVGYWQFSTAGFGVGNGTVHRTSVAQTIADTGTTLLLASSEVVEGYYSKVQGAENSEQHGGYTVPCHGDLPDLLLDVGDGAYTARVKGSDIVYAEVGGNRCYGGLQATTGSLQIWGDVFFKSQFVVFNGGNNTLGMAEHA